MTKVLKFILPIGIILLGVVLFRTVASMKPKVKKAPAAAVIPVVEVFELHSKSRKAGVFATGVVRPEQEVTLLPELGGKVTYVAKQLTPGGRVKKGQVLIRIDAREYQLSLEQQQGMLRNSELQVELEQARAELAKHEWELIGEKGKAPDIVSRKSQQAAAEVTVRSNKSAIRRARLNLARTVIRAPFDATVVSERVDVGQVVAPSFQLAQLVGTQRMRVNVSLALGDLDLIQIPSLNGEVGSSARIVQNLTPSKTLERKGQVVSLVERLDEQTRRAQVVVSVEDPFSKEGGLPLMPGAYVDVTIEGSAFESVLEVPRATVYEGNVVWVVNKNRELERRELRPAWGEAESLFLVEGKGGLLAGERVVFTRLAAPVVGMRVNTPDDVAADTPADAGAVTTEATPPTSKTVGAGSATASPGGQGG